MKNTIFVFLFFFLTNCANQTRKPQEYLSLLTAELSEEVAGNPMGNNYLSYQFSIQKNTTDDKNLILFPHSKRKSDCQKTKSLNNRL